MKKLVLRKIKPGKRAELERWFAELEGPRRSEASGTLRAEGVTREWGACVLLDGEDYLVGFMEGPAEFLPADLAVDVNRRHQEVLRECLDPAAKAVGEFGYDISF